MTNLKKVGQRFKGEERIQKLVVGFEWGEKASKKMVVRGVGGNLRSFVRQRKGICGMANKMLSIDVALWSIDVASL